MTKEEAIKWLRFDAETAKAEFYDDDRGWTDSNAKAVTEAEEMGIDALAERQDGTWKKANAIVLPAVKTKFGKAVWKVTSKDKKKVLSLSGSKVKVKKGAKKGTYTIKLKASVSKTKNYKAASSKVVTVKIKVK